MGVKLAASSAWKSLGLGLPHLFSLFISLLKCRLPREALPGHLKQGVGKLFSIKGQVVNSLGLAGHKVHVVTPHLSCGRTKAARDNV